MPGTIPELGLDFFNSDLAYPDLAAGMIEPFLIGELSKAELDEIVASAFDFEVPLVQVNETDFILELFHGPTLAFKDFAARFMARTMAAFLENENKGITILVATSGDTGSAVANGFLGMDGINVVILYPSKRVSEIQEKQLTTMGQNVTALEVDGSFDDCQRMVKKAFLDEELNKRKTLSSANSINIGRLLPQAVYYAWAWKQIEGDDPILFSVPCGNFGNLTGGLLAKKMGLLVELFIAATNANDVFPTYLDKGEVVSKPVLPTISNAMDVSVPSNLERINHLYGNDVEEIKRDIASWCFNDDETRTTIHELNDEGGYVADPHTAVGILGLKKYREKTGSKQKGVILSTAHPGKFADVVEPIIGEKIQLPLALQGVVEREKQSTLIDNNYSELREFLWESKDSKLKRI